MSVVAFGDIEDHSMGVELRCGVAVYRTGGVVLKGSRNEFACRLRRVDVANPRLGIAFQLCQRDSDRFLTEWTST